MQAVWQPVCRFAWLRTHASRHLVLHMSDGMTRLSCKVTPRPPDVWSTAWPHADRHHSAHMSLSMLRSQVMRHLVLLGVTPHAVLSWTSTARASLDTYHTRQLTSRPYLIDKATSSFSFYSTDFDPSGEFSSDQSRIFFFARSDDLNSFFNKLLMISELDEKYFPSLRLPRKIYNTEIRVFAQFRVFPSCFDPVLLTSRPA